MLYSGVALCHVMYASIPVEDIELAGFASSGDEALVVVDAGAIGAIKAIVKQDLARLDVELDVRRLRQHSG